MGQAKQPDLNVRVLGMDASGHPIRQDAQTLSVSRDGMVIGGIGASVNPGEILSVQYKDRKVRFRVLWAGEAGTSKTGQLGLEQVHPEDDLFQMEFPLETAPGEPQERGSERRHERRYEAALPVEVKSTQASPLRAEISDISLSGCYISTLYPVAVGLLVTVVFWIGDEKASVRGKVRTCVPGVGCGIEFLDVAEHTKKLLDDFTSHCHPASDRRGDGQGSAEAEIIVMNGPSQYSS